MRVHNTDILMVVYEKEGAKTFHLANLLAKRHTRAVDTCVQSNKATCTTRMC